MSRLSAIQVTWTACTVGAIACLPFAGDLVRRVVGGEHLGPAVGGVPRRLPHGDRVLDVRLRAVVHDRRQPERHDVPRAADHRAAELGAAVGGAARRWRTSAGRSRSSAWPWPGASLGRVCPTRWCRYDGRTDGGRGGGTARRREPGGHVPGDARRPDAGPSRSWPPRRPSGRAAASEHVTRLAEGGLVETQVQGRCKYVRLAGPHVAELLERLGEFGEPSPPRSLNAARDRRRLAAARTCYDHLAGRLGVAVHDAMLASGLLHRRDGLGVTARGQRLARRRSASTSATSSRAPPVGPGLSRPHRAAPTPGGSARRRDLLGLPRRGLGPPPRPLPRPRPDPPRPTHRHRPPRHRARRPRPRLTLTRRILLRQHPLTRRKL